MPLHRINRTLVLLIASTMLAACSSYVRRDDFDATIAELRDRDARLDARIDALQRDLERRFVDYDARFTRLEGRLRVDMTAHFDFDDARVREADRAALEEFAMVLRDHHPDVLVTVEGFADPAGSARYNERLGQRRAEAVREQLLRSGLSAERVRAVSYGEASNRQVVPGAWGRDGEPNRRVALVIDYVGPRRG